MDKTCYSAFAGTNLDEILQQEQVEREAVVGVCTSSCVLETVKDLRPGYPHLGLSGRGADFDPEARAFALKHLARIFGAEVV